MTLERVRRALASRPDIVEKRMVGGISFSYRDRMFCGVTTTGLMVRVGGRRPAGAQGPRRPDDDARRRLRRLSLRRIEALRAVGLGDVFRDVLSTRSTGRPRDE